MSESRKFESDDMPERMRLWLEELVRDVCQNDQMEVALLETSKEKLRFRIYHEVSPKEFSWELEIPMKDTPRRHVIEELVSEKYKEHMEREIGNRKDKMEHDLSTAEDSKEIKILLNKKAKEIAKKLDPRLTAKVIHAAQGKGKLAESEWYVMFEYEGLGEIRINPVSKESFYESEVGEFPVQLTEDYMNNRLEKDFEQYYKNFLNNQKPRYN